MEHFTGYRYEPWHYRYVGKEAALLIKNYFNNNLELFLQWYWRMYQPLS
jgi:D-alanyl-D-alanine carboxypeptidase